MVKLKREKWNNEYRIVIRDNDGKIISHRKYIPKKFGLREAKTKYNEDITLKENIHLYEWTKTREISDYHGLKGSKGKLKYQYYIKVKFKDGSTLSSRSQTFDSNTPIDMARNDALNGLYIRIHHRENPFESNAIEGKQIYDKEKPEIIKEGTIRYAKI